MVTKKLITIISVLITIVAILISYNVSVYADYESTGILGINEELPNAESWQIPFYNNLNDTISGHRTDNTRTLFDLLKDNSTGRDYFASSYSIYSNMITHVKVEMKLVLYMYAIVYDTTKWNNYSYIPTILNTSGMDNMFFSYTGNFSRYRDNQEYVCQCTYTINIEYDTKNSNNFVNNQFNIAQFDLALPFGTIANGFVIRSYGLSANYDNVMKITYSFFDYQYSNVAYGFDSYLTDGVNGNVQTYNYKVYGQMSYFNNYNNIPYNFFSVGMLGLNTASTYQSDYAIKGFVCNSWIQRQWHSEMLDTTTQYYIHQDIYAPMFFTASDNIIVKPDNLNNNTSLHLTYYDAEWYEIHKQVANGIIFILTELPIISNIVNAVYDMFTTITAAFNTLLEFDSFGLIFTFGMFCIVFGVLVSLM